jgi:hypothetical protein
MDSADHLSFFRLDILFTVYHPFKEESEVKDFVLQIAM